MFMWRPTSPVARFGSCEAGEDAPSFNIFPSVMLTVRVVEGPPVLNLSEPSFSTSAYLTT